MKDFWKERGKHTELLGVQIDGYEKRYEELKDIIEELKGDVKNHFREKLFPGARILDFGCGTGRYISLFYEVKNINIIDVDISESILNNFTRKNFPKVNFYCIDFERDKNFLKEYENTLDGIYSVSVIQYIRYKKLPLLIKIFYRMLKNQGILYLHFPHPNSRWDVMSGLNYIRYYPETVEKYLKRIGFKIKESYSFHHNRYIKKVDNSGLPNFGYVIVAEK